MALLSWGFCLYGQSTYLAELRRLHGWPSGAISGASTFLFVLSALLMAQIHRAVARFGARAVLIAGVLAIAAGALAEAHVTAIWQLYACTALLALGWAACSSVGIAVTIALWFERRRGFALSLAQNGAVVQFCFAFGPALLGVVHDLSGGYSAVLAVCAAFQLAGAAIMWRGRTTSHTP